MISSGLKWHHRLYPSYRAHVPEAWFDFFFFLNSSKYLCALFRILSFQFSQHLSLFFSPECCFPVYISPSSTYLMFFVNFGYSLLNSFVCIGVLLVVSAMSWHSHVTALATLPLQKQAKALERGISPAVISSSLPREYVNRNLGRKQDSWTYLLLLFYSLSSNFACSFPKLYYFCFLPRFLLSWFPDAHFMYSLTTYSFYLSGERTQSKREQKTPALWWEKSLCDVFQAATLWWDFTTWEFDVIA